jgi:hypothetical protein
MGGSGRWHFVVGCSGRDQANGVEFSFGEVLGVAAARQAAARRVRVHGSTVNPERVKSSV